MRGYWSRVAVKFAAAVVGVSMVSHPGTAHSETLIDFLWGGSAEYGGAKRRVVGFSQKYAPGQIIVSFGDRRLYHVVRRGKAVSYPIAVPRQQSRWEGVTKVSSKRVNPSWRPTPEMLRENPRLPSWVPGGHPMNPLGIRALYLGSSLYRIHGTDAPWTIGKAVSKGCVRMLNEDVKHLYPRIPVGTKVVVTWKRFKTGSAGQFADADYAPRPSEAVYKPKKRFGAHKKTVPAQRARAVAKKQKTDQKQPKKAPKEGFFIASDDEVVPEADMVVRYTRKVGAGAVARSATQAH